jgi:hypothetical protein
MLRPALTNQRRYVNSLYGVKTGLRDRCLHVPQIGTPGGRKDGRDKRGLTAAMRGESGRGASVARPRVGSLRVAAAAARDRVRGPAPASAALRSALRGAGPLALRELRRRRELVELAGIDLADLKVPGLAFVAALLALAEVRGALLPTRVSVSLH